MNQEESKVQEGVNSSATAEPESQKTAEENKPENKPDKKNIEVEKPKGNKRRLVLILLTLIVVLVIFSASFAYVAYFAWSQYQKGFQVQQQELTVLQQSLENLQKKNQDFLSLRENERRSDSGALSKLQERLDAAERRLIAQNKRLQSMSTTSREDWLLAEAEYLLKLANQRVLVERNAESADALLTEADGILRDLLDPDLFPLRQAIAKDLVALRLTKSIDLEGLYLALQALAEQVYALPTHPKPDFPQKKDELNNQPEHNPQEEIPWWSVPLKSFQDFVQAFKSQIKITPHEESGRPIVLMQPETVLYLQQNLRMQIERAQLALLREQQKIYTESLGQAQTWIEEYFPRSKESEAFVKQLDQISQESIVKTLPDISGSLELLNSYISQLHDLQGVKPVQQEGGE